MNSILVFGIALTLIASLVSLLVVLFRGSQSVDITAIETRLNALSEGQDRADRTLREEMLANRKETAGAGLESRLEIATSIKNLGESLGTNVGELGTAQKNQLAVFAEHLQTLTETNERRLEAVRTTIEAKFESLREVVDGRLRAIQEDNAKQLDQMRATVDEKLQSTLEKRLGESFSQVAQRLEQVHAGLGEMQVLATGVGDLKRLFANGRARGTWGEVQLGALLSDILTPEQYEENASVKEGSSERVEFAVKLPGDKNPILLPVDSKFPMEAYARLVGAFDAGDADGINEAGRSLEAAIKAYAKDIRDKYLEPPTTTDFGLMFLPSEALYAEVARRTDLLGLVRRDLRVLVCGPSTLAATLFSFRMGFRTLAIQKRTSEVWMLLGAVKTEFSKFGDLLAKVKTKLDQASSSILDAERKSRTIERRLRDVEVLPDAEVPALLRSEAHEDLAVAAAATPRPEDEDVPF